MISFPENKLSTIQGKQKNHTSRSFPSKPPNQQSPLWQIPRHDDRLQSHLEKPHRE